MQALEEPTRSYRQKRAAAHRQTALRISARLRLQGATETLVHDATRWHRAREQAQLGRIARVLDCGSDALQIICQDCGTAHEVVQGCRAGLFCVSCRGAIAAEKRGRFLAARGDVVAEARVLRLLDPARRGGPYGEKFLTLTVPHLPSDTVGGRIERLLSAWRCFLKRFNDHLRQRVIRRVEWFRVIEWTLGRHDHLGNPHLHCWLFSPYLDQGLLKTLWRQALCQAGCPPDACQNPIVDIRAMHDPLSGAHELIKYLTKDISENGEKLPPELYAQVLEALDGRRQTQASKGFMARARLAAPVCQCGSALPKRVVRTDRRYPVNPRSSESCRARAPKALPESHPPALRATLRCRRAPSWRLASSLPSSC